MNPQTLLLRALLFLGLWQTGRRSLASAPELQNQPRKIGKLAPESKSTHKHMSCSVQAPEVALMFHNKHALEVLFYNVFMWRRPHCDHTDNIYGSKNT